MARGAAENVVAVERGLERDGREEILVELLAELAQLVEREIVELATFVEAVANDVADLLVRGAEGHALVDEVGGGGHGVEEAGLRGGEHAVVAEMERAGEGREQREKPESVSATAKTGSWVSCMSLL